MSDKKGTNRRDFLKTCVIGTAVLGATDVSSFAKAVAPIPAGNSKVVLAKDAMLRGTGRDVDPKRALALLDSAMQAFYHTNNPVDPWKQIVKPGEVVGLKVNTIAGKGLSTNVALVEAVTERLQQAGVKAYDIIVWDRTNGELERAGFKLSSAAGKVRYMSTESVGYEEQPEQFGSVSCRLSKILTRNCDVIINMPLLKDHNGAGVTLSMKNMYGVIDNPTKWHARYFHAVADINMLPTIRKKVRFHVCDAATGCYHGGPMHKPEYTWTPNSLLVASDPVALDYTGWQIIDRKRVENGLKTLEAEGRLPGYIDTAADANHRLGISDPKRISVIEVSQR